MLKARTVLMVILFNLAATPVFAQDSEVFAYQSPYLRVEFAKDQPALTTLAVDSIGKGKLSVNPLIPPGPAQASFAVGRQGSRVEYKSANSGPHDPPLWVFKASERRLELSSANKGNDPVPALVMDFDLHLCHATLLGLMNEDGSVRLPALLHLPDHGTFRITSNAQGEVSLGYEVLHYPAPREKEKFVRIKFPGAPQATRPMDYSLDVVAIYPEVKSIETDPRFDGFRRNFINIFQLSPRFHVLANNAASDACAITVYQYAEVALRTPPLAEGLTALDLVRQTMDRYLHGLKGCGMKGYNAGTKNETGFDFLDAYPSLIIAGADYALGSHDRAWLRDNYEGLQGWTRKMLDFDSDGDGLLEYPQTRESGPWPWNHPANWWDAIWFTHKDAFSNALAYRALLDMAEVARLAGKPEDAKYYSSRAEKLRSIYATTFYNPATGVLAGWKDPNGNFHDYYFTFVNGMAVSFGLVPKDMANKIMDRLFEKMKEVGYDRFDMGLPGNLIPVRKADYNSVGIEWGGPEKDDGSDAFQNYENGGASACYVNYTIDALYQLGRSREADQLLFPLLRAFEEGQFQRRDANGRTSDWRRWDGTSKGYEGLLADNYLALMAVLSRK